MFRSTEEVCAPLIAVDDMHSQSHPDSIQVLRDLSDSCLMEYTVSGTGFSPDIFTGSNDVHLKTWICGACDAFQRKVAA